MFKKKWVIFLVLVSVLIVFFVPNERIKEWTCAHKIGQDYCLILIYIADDKKEYDKEKKYLEISARYGNAVAQRQLGLMYGIDLVEKDYQKSIYWLKKSLEHNEDKLSLAALGNYYKNGFGVEQNYEKAFELYKKSAEQGYDLAQFELGIMYDKGLGVDQDYAQAMKWYQKAAEQGHANAQALIGVLYHNGLGVEQNHRLALQWYEKAAKQDFSPALTSIGYMYENGHGMEKNLIKAKEYFEKGCNLGSQSGCKRLELVKKEISNS